MSPPHLPRLVRPARLSPHRPAARCALRHLGPLALSALAMLPPAAPAADPGHVHHATAAAAAPEAPQTAEGEVRRVDKAQGRLTLRHGPLPHLGMPAMTMVFRVADPVMLARVQPGDRVRFQAERVNGQVSVTRLERLP